METDTAGSTAGLLAQGSFLRERWEILKKIGGGGFGEIYKARDHVTNLACAVKVESCSSNKQVLKMEVAVLKRLQNSSAHICEFIGCGRNSKVNYLVMSLLGPNLSELRKHQPHQKFSISTTLRVGIQIIAAVQAMHDCGFLHRDIKPSNFAIGDTPETSRTCYMLDYGLARQYTTVTGEVRQPRSVAGFRGTVRYASVNAHLSRDLGRHDDLWSVFYLLSELAIGHLPWRRIKDKEEAGEYKSQYDHKKLLRGLPVELNDFLEHLRCSSYFDKPDYPRIVGALQEAMNRLNIQESDPYDWEQDFSAPSVTTASVVSPPAVKLVHEERGADVPSPTRTQPEPSRTNCSGVADLSEGRSEQRDENKRFLKVPRPLMKSTPPDANLSQDYQDLKPSTETSSKRYQAAIPIDHKLKENLNIVNKYISDEEENDQYRDAVSNDQQCLSPHLDASNKESSVSFEQRSSPQANTGGGGVTPMKSYQTESLNRFFDMESNIVKESYKSLSKESLDEKESHNISSKYFSKRYDVGGSNKSDLLNNAVIYPESRSGADVASGFNLSEENVDLLQPRSDIQARKLRCEDNDEEWSSREDAIVKPSHDRIVGTSDSVLASENRDSVRTQQQGNEKMGSSGNVNVRSRIKERIRSQQTSLDSLKAVADRSRSKERIKSPEGDKMTSLDNIKVMAAKSRSKESPEDDSVDSEDNISRQSSNEPLRKLVVCQLLVNSNTSEESESSKSIEMLFAQRTQNTDFTNHPASDENKDVISGSTRLDFDDQRSSQPENSSAVQLISAEMSPEDEKPNIHVTVSEYTGRNSLARIGPQATDENSQATHSRGEPARQTKSVSNFLEVSPKTMRIHPRPPPNPPPHNYSVSLLARRRRFVRSTSLLRKNVPKKS